MGYLAFAEHSECYIINGVTVRATANFVTRLLWIQWDNNAIKKSLEEYEAFDGGMEEFVTVIVGEHI